MGKYDSYLNNVQKHYVSNSPHNEKGAIKGGIAGDQTGHEWELVSWYNMPWNVVLRYTKDKNVGLKLAELGCAAALNNQIGYDQPDRYSYWTELQKVNYDPSKITKPCNVDCSDGVLANVKAVGYYLGLKNLQNVNIYGYTGNMSTELQQAGFTALTDSKFTASPDYLLPGDILLKVGKHTCTNITYGSKVRPEQPQTKQEDSEVKILGTAIAKTAMKVRDKDNVKGKVLGYVSQNQAAEVVEILNNGWYKIKWDNGYGYTSNINNAYYTFMRHETIRDDKYKVKINTKLYIRKGPSKDYPFIGTLDKGDIKTIIQTQKGWGLLESGSGWISLTYTTKV